MKTEIKRNYWSRFIKKFSAANRYRQATVALTGSGRKKIEISGDTPFAGVGIGRKGRSIESIELLAGQHDPEQLTMPVVSVNQPQRLTVYRDPEGRDMCLSIKGEKGTVAMLTLAGDPDQDQYRGFVQKLAYSIYERRGCQPGQHVEHWLEAEEKIREAELEYSI